MAEPRDFDAFIAELDAVGFVQAWWPGQDAAARALHARWFAAPALPAGQTIELPEPRRADVIDPACVMHLAADDTEGGAA